MFRTSFDDGWKVRPRPNPFVDLSGATAAFHPVQLPFDATVDTVAASAVALEVSRDGTLLATADGHTPLEIVTSVEEASR